MYAPECSQYRSLSAIVQEEISWVSNTLLAHAMGITTRQLRTDVESLKQLGLIQLHEVEREIKYADPIADKRRRPFRCKRKGFTRQTAEIIWLFRQVVRERGRLLAIESIYLITQDFYS